MKIATSTFPCKILLVLAVFAAGSVASAGPVGVVVQHVSFDGDTHIATITLFNGSDKDVTAFTLKISETQNTGEIVEGYRQIELLLAMLSKQPVNGTDQIGEGGFRAGETRNEIIKLDPKTTNVDAQLLVVAFADDTAIVNDEAAFQRLLTDRKSEAAGAQEAYEIMRKALANDADPHPAFTAMLQLQQALERQHVQHPGVSDEELTRAILNMKNINIAVAADKTTNEREMLNGTATNHGRLLAPLAKHAQTRRLP